MVGIQRAAFRGENQLRKSKVIGIEVYLHPSEGQWVVRQKRAERTELLGMRISEEGNRDDGRIRPVANLQPLRTLEI